MQHRRTWNKALALRLQALWKALSGTVAWAVALACGVWLATAAPAIADDGFVLCGEVCGELRDQGGHDSFFVGYGRGQHLELLGEVVDLPGRSMARSMTIYPHVKDFQAREAAPNVDEQHLRARAKAGVQTEEVNSGQVELQTEGSGETHADIREAVSIHRFDDVRVGYLKKSEDLSLPALPPETQRSGKVEAKSDLVWGDTLRISSKRLSEGSPVALQIEREVGGGFGQPATDYANYRLSVQLWVNGHLIPKLDYQLAKYSGPGEIDRQQGAAQAAASVIVKVGDAVTLESRLQVKDGVVASDDAQRLEGNDWVSYGVKLLSDDSCATSDSGLLTTGDCL